MPFSWIRVPNHLNHKAQEALGEDYAPTDFSDYVLEKFDEGVRANVQVYFELNAIWAHVFFPWEDREEKERIIYALEGEDVLDLITPSQAGDLRG